MLDKNSSEDLSLNSINIKRGLQDLNKEIVKKIVDNFKSSEIQMLLKSNIQPNHKLISRILNLAYTLVKSLEILIRIYKVEANISEIDELRELILNLDDNGLTPTIYAICSTACVDEIYKIKFLNLKIELLEKLSGWPKAVSISKVIAELNALNDPQRAKQLLELIPFKKYKHAESSSNKVFLNDPTAPSDTKLIREVARHQAESNWFLSYNLISAIRNTELKENELLKFFLNFINENTIDDFSSFSNCKFFVSKFTSKMDLAVEALILKIINNQYYDSAREVVLEFASDSKVEEFLELIDVAEGVTKEKLPIPQDLLEKAKSSVIEAP